MSDLVETLNLLANVWIQFMIRQSWQVGIVFLVVGAVTLALRRRSAALCYCLWLLVLIRFLLPPDFAFVTGAGHWLPRLGVQTEPEFAVSAPVDVAPPQIPVYHPQVEQDIPRRDLSPAPSFTPQYEPAPEVPRVEIPRTPMPRLTSGAILMLVWAAMVVTVLVLLMKRSRIVSRILREGRPVTDDKTIALAEECRAAVRLRRPVHLLSSARVPMPVAIGILRRSVVVPDRLLEELSRDELRAVFLHEFLHLKRLDPLVSFVQRVVQALYLYHPAAWLANGMLDVLRERICDDHVLSLMSTDSETYGETLVRAVELAPSGVPASGGLVSIAESKRQLKDRLQRIAQVDRKLVYKLSLASILALVCIAAVVLPLGQMDTGGIVEETEERPAGPDKTASHKGATANGAEKAIQEPDAKVEIPDERTTSVLKGTKSALASSVNTRDVERIEVVIFYSEPVRYLVTTPVPIREIVEGLQEPTQSYTPPAGFTEGPDCTLVIVTKSPKIEVPLGLDYGRLVASVGDPPLTPSPRLKRILDIILLRLTGVREVPTSDEDLPGGFASWEAQYPEREHDVEFALTLLDAVVDGYGRRSYLSDSDKVEWSWASAYRANLDGATKYVDRVSANLYGFIEETKADMSVSPEFGGIPYAVMAQLKTRFALANLYEKTGMYDRALGEYEQLDELLTSEIVSMATNEPTGTLVTLWHNRSLQPHLKWLKESGIQGFADKCRRLSQPGAVPEPRKPREEELPEYRQYVEALQKRDINTLTGNEKSALEAEQMGELVGKGRRLKHGGAYRSAIATFDDVIREYPESIIAVFVHHYIGDCYAALGEQEKADDVRREGIERGKTIVRNNSGAAWLPNVWFCVVTLYTDLDQPSAQDARDMRACALKCDVGLKHDPELLNAHWICGNKLRELGYVDEAEEEYRHVLKPRALDERRMAAPVRGALRGLVELLAEQGRRPEVEEACRAVISDFPRNSRDAQELLGKAVAGPETSGPGKGKAKGVQKTVGNGEARDEGVTDAKEARSKVFGDPLWREFMNAYQALQSEEAVSLGEEFLEKYGTEPEALMIYGFVAGAYGWDDSIPEEVREERRKTVLERGIAACEGALEKSDPVAKLGMLATLGRLCGMRAVGPGWHDEVYAKKGIGAYREAIDIAESLLHDSGDDEVRRTASAYLWPVYKGMGFIYETQEDFPQAVAVCEEALKHRELTKRRGLIQQALAETYHKCGKRAEEMQTYLDMHEEASIHKTHFKPSVKRALIDMYQAAVSATTDVQTLETLSNFADVYRQSARLIARDAAAIAESQSFPQWRITSWQNLLPVADLLVDYGRESNAPERRDNYYTLLLKVWPEDERFESVVLVRLGKLYEEMGRRQDAVNAYHRVMAIEHDLTMRERLEARARLQDLGEDVQFGQGQQARGTETPEVDREESKIVTQSTTQTSSRAQRRLQFRWVVEDGESPSSSALVPFPTGPVQRKSLLVFREVLFDESDIESAQVEDVPELGGTRVNAKLKPEAAQRFAQITGENVGRRLAIVFNGEVIRAPTVKAGIQDGRLRIHLAGGQVDAEALLAAIRGEEVSPGAAATTPSTDTVAAHTATVVGQVTDAHTGEPVAGVGVFCRPHQTATASDGTYRLENVPAGKRNVGAGDKAWYLVPYRQGAISNYYNIVQHPEVYLEPGKETRLDMQVIKGGRIKGIVKDASGQPVANTYIWIVNQKESTQIVAAKTGALGHLTSFGLVPDVPLEFLVRTSDGRGSARRVTTLQPGETREVDFTLDPQNEYRITGSVYNSSGAPISGVQLGCFWKRGRSGGGRWDVETDEQGRYWFSGLEPDTEYTMYAYGDPFGCATVTRTVRLSDNRRAVRADFSLATEETAAPSETGAVGQPATDAGATSPRTLCAANLKALSQVFHMYANEWNGRYPPIDGRRGNLMVEGDALFPRYAQYLDGVHTFQCPAREPRDRMGLANVADAVTDEGYFYLGWVVTTEREGLAVLDAYGSLDMSERDGDLRVRKGQGNAGGNWVYRVREGIERFYITDINDPAASAKVQDRLPVMWERPENHSMAGGHVLYMSGRVEFVEYPGKFPMTATFINRLAEISTTETIKSEATFGKQLMSVIERVAPTEARTVRVDRTAGVRKEPDIPEKPVVIRADTDERHRLDEYPYREESRDGATHVLGTIHGSVVWEKEKNPYVMDENVFVAQDGDLTIEPGVIVKVVRLPRGPCNNFGGRITLNVLGTLAAEGRPDAMIWFTAASDVPAERDEWSGLRFREGSSASILKWAVVEYAMGGVDAYGSPLIAHCVFRYCTHGVYLERDFAGDVRHNVIAYCSNPIACTGTRAEATIINNISYAGFGGIHAWANAAPYADYNLYWSSKIKDEASRYYRGIVPGPHDLHLDPRFVDPHEDNFRLVRSSLARGAGFGRAEKRPRMIRWIPLIRPQEPDMGLFIRGWSRKAAKRESDEWFSDGARSLWYAGLQVERKWPEEAQQYYEQALQRDVTPELRYKIACSLGRVHVALGRYEQARTILGQVLSESRFPHMRDLARREIAEAFASEGRTEEALALLKETEWPQSHVWVESANATYSVAGGDYQDSLAYLDRLQRNEPGLYVKAVSELVSDRLAARQVEAAAALSKGFDAYPLCNAAPVAYLDIAKACRKAERPELAVRLLRKSCERDPFSKEAPESLSLLAEILESDLGREEEAAAVRARLCRDYFPFNSYVMDAHRILAEKGASLARTPRNKMILIDGTFSEWSIFDRRAWGTNYCSQHDVIRILTKAGYVVHTNRRERFDTRNAAELTPALLRRYGLVVCNGRFRGRADPPMPSEVIETLVDYVQEGGTLLIVAGGKNLWEGGLAEFYNPLTQQFGLRFIEGADLEYGDGATTNHPAVRDLEKFVHVTGCPVRVEGGDVLGYAGDEPIIAVAEYGNGRIVAAGIGIGFAGGILGPTRHYTKGRHPENEKLLVALASYLLSEVPERPVTTPQRAQRERVSQKRGVEEIVPEPQRDLPQARQQRPEASDSNSVAPLTVIPGDPISEEEARKIVQRLRSRLCLPREHLESLKCEFEPRFVDTTKYAQRWAEETGEEPPIPEGAKVGHFEGTLIPSFLFLRDNGLSRARRAVLYWKKADANLPLGRNVTTVLLYDEQGKRIKAHPAIGPALGLNCLRYMDIHRDHAPFWMVEPDERFQTYWRLHAPTGGPKTLYMIYNAVREDSWNMAKVVFEEGKDVLPLSAGKAWWRTRLKRWSSGESVEYGRLGKSGKVAIVRFGTDPYVLKYTWTNIGGAWVVNRVQGTTPDLDDYDIGKWVPWERAFTNFEINPRIPEGLLDWPRTPPLKMDLSTPDTAIETIMNCLRAGREDLLPYCSVKPPDGPVPTEAMPNMMAYWFEEFDHMRDGLRVLEKRQENEHWIYKVQIPQPTSGHRRSFDIKLVPAGDDWKMDVDMGRLLFQFWD